jgi:hypothetical protein
MRALNILQLLEGFAIQHEVSPLELAKQDKQIRQRARNSDSDNAKKSDW